LRNCAMRTNGTSCEGLDSMHWILLDYVNVVVHIFMPEERGFYDLESLWSDAPVVTVTCIGYGDFCLFLVFRMMVVDGIYAGFSYIDLSDSL